MKESIKTYLGGIIKKLAPGFKNDILVEIPENKDHGDYTTNVAFALSSARGGSASGGKKPREIAENLAAELTGQKISNFLRIEAKNGFVNFFLSIEYLYAELGKISKEKGKYGNSTLRRAQGKK
ncbi:MAG: hypothetical protein Q7J30_00230, partial [Candidatus Azambacteria bacterium]|nr:hypothetical protein [Candidatus Azambacteria bacterium]